MEISTDKEEIKDELHELEDTQQDESEEEDEDEEVEEAAEWYDMAQLRNLAALPISYNNGWWLYFLDHIKVRLPYCSRNIIVYYFHDKFKLSPCDATSFGHNLGD